MDVTFPSVCLDCPCIDVEEAGIFGAFDVPIPKETSSLSDEPVSHAYQGWEIQLASLEAKRAEIDEQIHALKKAAQMSGDQHFESPSHIDTIYDSNWI